MNKNIIIGITIGIVLIIGIVLFTIIPKNENTETIGKVDETFEISYKGIVITPKTTFNKEAIAEEVKVSEIPSCAFEGTDNVYTYENLEITTAKVEEKETIYSVYFTNSEMQTKEGVKITDDKAKMMEVYGNNYEEQGSKYAYTKGDVNLSFIIENDVITSIEYTWKDLGQAITD